MQNFWVVFAGKIQNITLCPLAVDGRELCTQELNITRLVASTRCSVIADSFIGESGVQRLKKRKISLAAVRKDKYPKNQFKIKLNKQFKDLLSSQSAQRSSND